MRDMFLDALTVVPVRRQDQERDAVRSEPAPASVTQESLAAKLRALRDARDVQPGNNLDTYRAPERKQACPHCGVYLEATGAFAIGACDKCRTGRPDFADEIDRLVADMVQAGDVVFDPAANCYRAPHYRRFKFEAR